MAQQDPELVRKIAQEVLRALEAERAESTPESHSPGMPEVAAVQPPAGVCTGDYSKFQELAGKDVGAKAPPEGAKPQAAAIVALSGIVTAAQLEAAMKAAPDGVAVLAPDARLTPLANDLARQSPKRVRRADAPVHGSTATVSDANLPWFWWIDGSCPAVAAVVSQHAGRLTQSSAGNRPSALAQVVRDLASAIKSKRVAGGLLFVHSAARAMCFANRCASIRAVVGTCGEAVEEGIAELGANVLVLEYPHHGQRAMAAMVERMMAQTIKVQPAVERDLADLHRCG